MSGEQVKKRTFMDRLSDFSERCIPDAFPLVLILTVLVAILALALTDTTPMLLLENWYGGFWGMISFTFQVCGLMFTGYLVADSMPVRKMLIRLARIPKTTTQAILLFMTVMFTLNYLHFALAIAGAIMLGRAMIVEQAKKGNKIPYAMFVSIGFFGIMYQGGPTAGSPLLVAAPGHFMEDVIGVLPLNETMLTLPMICMNLTIFAITLIVFPRLVPKKDYETVDEERLKKFEKDMALDTYEGDVSIRTFAEKVDNTAIFQKVVGIAGLFIFAVSMYKGGMTAFGLNACNFLFLMLALVLHKSPATVIKSSKEGIKTISNVFLQYSFYAGILGILTGTGLGAVFCEWFVKFGNERNFTTIVYWFSALLNMFIPSGGSQFMVEAPYILPAANEIGVSTAYVVNAFTVGDLTTNLIQPFWALPALTVFGCKFRKIFPYCAIACAIGFTVMTFYFYFWMH